MYSVLTQDEEGDFHASNTLRGLKIPGLKVDYKDLHLRNFSVGVGDYAATIAEYLEKNGVTYVSPEDEAIGRTNYFLPLKARMFGKADPKLVEDVRKSLEQQDVHKLRAVLWTVTVGDEKDHLTIETSRGSSLNYRVLYDKQRRLGGSSSKGGVMMQMHILDRPHKKWGIYSETIKKIDIPKPSNDPQN